MSGYLRSLATHAAMPGPRLRPIAVPFTRAPLAAPDVESLEASSEAPAPMTPAPSSPPPPSATSPRPTTPPVDMVMERSREDIAAPPKPLTLPEAVRWLTAPPATPDKTAHPVARPPAASANVSSRSIDRTATAPIDLPLPVPREGKTTHVDIDTSSRPTMRPRTEAAIVKPAAIPPSPPPRVAEPRGPSPRRHHETAPDVHIHIGRIELTAVPEPAAPPRRRPAQKTAMPLEEYLQRRNGRSQ